MTINKEKLLRDIIALSSVGIVSFFFGRLVMLALLNIPWWILALGCSTAVLPASVMYIARAGSTRIGHDESYYY